ncbi:hypothetical protein B0H11DRAFT_1922062 [Mycena galericulata]|nr:hypothetical protein B0H11DRAFT_1922062 [Mycena galericulata]
MEPFVLEECGIQHYNHWVAIRLADEDAPERNRFKEIVVKLNDWCVLSDPTVPSPPVLTVAPAPGYAFAIEFFDEWLGSTAIRKRVKALMGRYTGRRGGDRPSIRVTGLEILQNGKVVDRFPFMNEGWDLSG